jgi:hypothetical protein
MEISSLSASLATALAARKASRYKPRGASRSNEIRSFSNQAQ